MNHDRAISSNTNSFDIQWTNASEIAATPLAILIGYNSSSNSSSFERDCLNVSGIEGRKVTSAEIIACIIAIVTVIENAVILLAIGTGPRSLRKPPYWFISSLAAADLLTGFEIALAIFIPVGTSPLSRIVLKGLAVATFIASTNSLLLISFDRYFRIVRCAEYQRFFTKNCVFSLITMFWLLSFIIFIAIPLMGWSCADQFCCASDGLCICKRLKPHDDRCYTDCSQSLVPFAKSYLLIGAVYFIIAVTVMVSFYVGLFRFVKRKSFNSHATTEKKSSGRSKLRELQLAKTLILTLSAFIICWLPVMALFIADVQIKFRSENLLSIFDYVLVPTVINSMLNPIIYSTRLPPIKKAVKGIAASCFNCPYNKIRRVQATSTQLQRSTKPFSDQNTSKNKCNEESRGNGSQKPVDSGRNRLASCKSELTNTLLSTSSWA